MKQSTNSILMVEPVRFCTNPLTLADNSFHLNHPNSPERVVQDQALHEFTQFTAMLRLHGVQVTVYRDVEKSDAPDSIYPNNWFSTHDSLLVLYPMKAENRRRERREHIIADLKARYQNVLDLAEFENKGQYLEGTGSLVLDRVRNMAFASLSPRTNETLARHWADQVGYRLMTFHACDQQRIPVYHTNVMMSIGTGYAVMCLESISDAEERKAVKLSLLQAGVEVIPIDLDQMKQFCANILELSRGEGKPLLVMSERAKVNFRRKQLDALMKYAEIAASDLSVIETYGGGGARCMIAELF